MDLRKILLTVVVSITLLSCEAQIRPFIAASTNQGNASSELPSEQIGAGFSIPTLELGSDPNTEWTDFSDGTNNCTDAGGVIKMRDNSSTLNNQTKLRCLGYTLTDAMIIRRTVRIVSLNDASSWNPTDADIVTADASQTGDDPLNRVGFSFPIVNEYIDVRAQIWFQKAQDFNTSGEIEIWKINESVTPGFLDLIRIYSGTAIPMNTVFSYDIEYRLHSLAQYVVKITVNGQVLAENQLVGMISDTAGNGNISFQAKGTAEEPVEVDIHAVEQFNITPINGITFVQTTANPVDAGSNATNAVSIPLPTSAQEGDLLFLIAGDRTGTPTYTLTDGANQSWTRIDPAISTSVIFWARYNGSWGAADDIVITVSTANCTSGVCSVWRPTTSASTWEVDVAFSNVVTASGLNHANAGNTVGNYKTVTVAPFLAGSARDLITIGSLWYTGGRFRNLASSDRTYSMAYKTLNAAGSTGFVGNVVTSGTNFQTTSYMITFRQVNN